MSTISIYFSVCLSESYNSIIFGYEAKVASNVAANVYHWFDS